MIFGGGGANNLQVVPVRERPRQRTCIGFWRAGGWSSRSISRPPAVFELIISCNRMLAGPASVMAKSAWDGSGQLSWRGNMSVALNFIAHRDAAVYLDARCWMHSPGAGGAINMVIHPACPAGIVAADRAAEALFFVAQSLTKRGYVSPRPYLVTSASFLRRTVSTSACLCDFMSALGNQCELSASKMLLGLRKTLLLPSPRVVQHDTYRPRRHCHRPTRLLHSRGRGGDFPLLQTWLQEIRQLVLSSCIFAAKDSRRHLSAHFLPQSLQTCRNGPSRMHVSRPVAARVVVSWTPFASVSTLAP